MNSIKVKKYSEGICTNFEKNNKMKKVILKNNTHWICVFFLFPLLMACNKKMSVSLIVDHAKIYTVDSSFSVVSAMAIKDGKIVATGTSESIFKQYEADSVLDAQGKFIFPGFIDAHCHFTGYATDMWKCELVGTTSFEAVVDKLKTYSTSAPMEWIYGRGWDQNDWDVKQFPDKKILDSLFPNRPVFLKRIDGHAALANNKALQLAGIDTHTEIAGGSVELKNQQLTGILIDNAMDLVEKIIPPLADSLAVKYYLLAQEICFAEGLTGVHDCGVSEHTIELVDAAQKSGFLKMKIFALLSDSSHYYDKWIQKGPYQTERLHVGGFKLYADGALGSRGACMLHSYDDKNNWNGFLLSNQQHFESVATKLANSKFQMCTHAIGDSGNRVILNIYAKTLKGKQERRWRIEHAQVVNNADFHLFGDAHIIPSVQPTHATSDMYWAEDRIGKERLAGAYAYQQLLQQNGWMPLGTDFPVEYISPMKTFLAAVARTDGNGYPKDGFQKENALTRVQAIRGMTIWAAKAAFEEKEKGSLEPGKTADFIILDTDLMECNWKDILKTKVYSNYVNGEAVYNLKQEKK
jgi:predicted amidohydrolase YtcJ